MTYLQILPPDFTEIICLLKVIGGLFLRVIITPGSASHNDFNVLSSTKLNFSPGVREGNVVIAIKNDSINENDEVFVVTIASSNASVHVDKDKGVTIVTVLDDTSK